MKTEFVSLTFVRACTGFATSPQLLSGHHPMTFTVGTAGCVGIRQDSLGGFDVYGVDGQHFWVAPANAIWGRKAVCEDHPGTPDVTPVAAPTSGGVVGREGTLGVPTTAHDSKIPWVDPVVKPPVTPPRPVGRPRKR